MSGTTITTTTITFIDIFRNWFIRKSIFNAIESIDVTTTSLSWVKGRLIRNNTKQMLKCGVDWSFIKHHKHQFKLDIINKHILLLDQLLIYYCSHPQANLSTLINILLYIYPFDYQPNGSIFNQASESGHINIAKYLHYRYPNIKGVTYDAMDCASKNGHYFIVRFLHYNRSEGCSKMAIDWSSRSGYVSIVSFLTDHRTEGSTKLAMDYAAESGMLHILKYLHYNRTEGCSKMAIDQAAFNEQRDVLLML
ncbi:hypothetical protein DFA_03526 [Cavenderia fasciculata]|uniref:Ankyrin repeat-containing protein n=1 Tax=Cavenderia fasciculata TaxID=261658 RepID=F4PHU4_CACFS|nr:uncharacterized protein DFA_03526 [Cavenderia fasciculata]EGG25278.1 hypothetical protein DFA_03526 [Cavenderia fasciculata]|eukprot:XP_004363129.1 hypothetical protein DFA_03526 [Cavenderia fasciculata]